MTFRLPPWKLWSICYRMEWSNVSRSMPPNISRMVRTVKRPMCQFKASARCLCISLLQVTTSSALKSKLFGQLNRLETRWRKYGCLMNKIILTSLTHSTLCWWRACSLLLAKMKTHYEPVSITIGRLGRRTIWLVSPPYSKPTRCQIRMTGITSNIPKIDYIY